MIYIKMDGLICPVIYNSCLIVSLICIDRIMFCFYWCDDGEKKTEVKTPVFQIYTTILNHNIGRTTRRQLNHDLLDARHRGVIEFNMLDARHRGVIEFNVLDARPCVST